ncbi:KRAB-A domain-containing protein 2-like [Aphis craccivora]|uniref:KRAB-A domain-containing protein 2-like n=1 Tax=Aphis craccivora TaxID=307492 RepID=A0A6G0ZN56_APHCR|nr:KRAB-A domain-containing protein 2-like [Aphis craccivora]
MLWSNEGLRSIQFMKNRSLHHEIKCSPCEVMLSFKNEDQLREGKIDESVKIGIPDDVDKAWRSAIHFRIKILMKLVPLWVNFDNFTLETNLKYAKNLAKKFSNLSGQGYD